MEIEPNESPKCNSERSAKRDMLDESEGIVSLKSLGLPGGRNFFQARKFESIIKNTNILPKSVEKKVTFVVPPGIDISYRLIGSDSWLFLTEGEVFSIIEVKNQGHHTQKFMEMEYKEKTKVIPLEFLRDSSLFSMNREPWLEGIDEEDLEEEEEGEDLEDDDE